MRFASPALAAKRLRRVLAVLILAAWTAAQAEPVKIVFLPPPMEGVLSVGVYDNAGTLVRVLQREAEWSEFTADDNGLTVQWDGKDDHGAVCPTGTYRVRGVAVGDVGVEGVGFIGNDWVTSDDSPHIRSIGAMVTDEKGKLIVSAEQPGQGVIPAFFSVMLKPAETPGEDPEVVLHPDSPPPNPIGLPIFNVSTTGTVSALTTGTGKTTWGIYGKKDIRQLSPDKTVLRTIKTDVSEPSPVRLAASRVEDKLYVLYETAQMQRLSGYDFTGVKRGGEPKVLFENDIVFSDRYEQVAAELKFPDDKPFTASPVLTVALQPNPLANNKPGTLLIRVDVDKNGAYLAAADGLPLCHISETKALRWAVLGRPANSKAITVFDSDGAVVEQFQVSKIANMMTFDAGTVQWTAPVPTPTPAPSATPTATPSATPAAAAH